jgi:hypothetical protein
MEIKKPNHLGASKGAILASFLTLLPNSYKQAIRQVRITGEILFSEREFQEPCRWDCWRNLECFLFHFRNLIEFFGREPLLLMLSGKEPKTTDDLSILKARENMD